MPFIIHPKSGKFIVDKGQAYYALAEIIGLKKMRELPRYLKKPTTRKRQPLAKRGKPQARKRRKDGCFVSSGKTNKKQRKPKKRIKSQPRQPRQPRQVTRRYDDEHDREPMRELEPIVHERIIERRPVQRYSKSDYDYDYDDVPSSLADYREQFDESWKL